MGRLVRNLFGDLVPVHDGGAGRPEHVPTPESVNKVRVLVLAGWRLHEIAREMGLSAPTLRKHYFSDMEKAKAEALRVAEARGLMALDALIEAGNVGAIKTWLNYVAAAKLRDVPVPAKVPTKALGKKELRAIEARMPQGGWADLVPAPAPAALN